MKSTYSTEFSDYEFTSLLQIVIILDETTYDNYKEFHNICLQHTIDKLSTDSVKTPTLKADYKQ